VKTKKVGGVDFLGYLALMRKCHSLHITARFDKEKRATEETGFNQAEIHEFRQLFLNADINGDEELSLPEFKKMLSQICPMGEKNSNALSTIFHSIVCEQHNVEGKDDEADFPEFLWVWHGLLECNFGGIREKTAGGQSLKSMHSSHKPEPEYLA